MAAAETPSPRSQNGTLGREKTPEVARPESESRQKRSRDDVDKDLDDRSHSDKHRRHRDDDHDRERERRRDRERRHRDDETDEEREERRRRRKERDLEKEKERAERVVEDEGSVRDSERSRRKHRSRRERSGSRESYRSHNTGRSARDRDDRRPRDVDMDVDERDRRPRRDYDRERERMARDREMADERRIEEDRRRRDDRGGRSDERHYEPRRGSADPRDAGLPPRPSSPPRRRRPSPVYDPAAARRRSPEPRKDEAEALLQEIDSETRSVFVSQLAAALTSRDLGLFFEDKLGRGSVRDSRVVTDRVTRRSKGIAYVELDSVELVPLALNLSGTKVMGLPIMITLTESERNNQASTNIPAALSMPGAPASGPGSLPPLNTGLLRPAFPNMPNVSTGVMLPNGMSRDANADASIPYYRLYVGNLFYSLTAEDIRQVFEPFGELAFVDLPLEPGTNRSRGYAFVQFTQLAPAEMALASMNGFELAGRQIKVSTVHEKGGVKLPGGEVETQLEETTGTGYGTKMDATARQQLMFKLARQPEPSSTVSGTTANTVPVAAARPSFPTQQTQFVQVQNMFNPVEEDDPHWAEDLEEDTKGEVEAKYGKLTQIVVDKRSQEGNVYMKFVDVKSAATAVEGLNGRFFGGRSLKAAFIGEAFYKAHTPSS